MQKIFRSLLNRVGPYYMSLQLQVLRTKPEPDGLGQSPAAWQPGRAKAWMWRQLTCVQLKIWNVKRCATFAKKKSTKTPWIFHEETQLDKSFVIFLGYRDTFGTDHFVAKLKCVTYLIFLGTSFTSNSVTHYPCTIFWHIRLCDKPCYDSFIANHKNHG